MRVLHDDGVRVERHRRPRRRAEPAGLLARLWELLAPPELRANSCLIVMGSEGRGEQIIKTDQDNALLLRDGFAFGRARGRDRGFTAALIEFGYPPCPGGIMLSRPLWRQPLGGFRETLRDWIHGGDPEGPMNLAIFLDAARGGRRRDAAGGGARLCRRAARRQRRLLRPLRQRRRPVRRAGAGGRGCRACAAATAAEST